MNGEAGPVRRVRVEQEAVGHTLAGAPSGRARERRSGSSTSSIDAAAVDGRWSCRG